MLLRAIAQRIDRPSVCGAKRTFLMSSGWFCVCLQVWRYDEGTAQYKGLGHSGVINCVRISPDQQTVVSVGELRPRALLGPNEPALLAV